MTVLGAAAALVIVATACAATTGTRTGGTTSAPARQSTVSATASSTSVTAAHGRPRDIPFDVVDPCALLTPEQLPALDIVGTPGRIVLAPHYRAMECAWTDIGVDNRLVAVTVEGISAWTAGRRAGRPTRIEPILGYPAITVTLPADDNRCDVMVDTADGQYLAATFSVRTGYEKWFPAPCDGARRLAEAAMSNLVG